ncbi:hypothetical protein [uncultured Polaribacter sp.]|uniref:hypothetical protein n=1 Tax=uncultured Polaribacter sp. TaxID=174711 RepID=UPI00263785F8|nr:hypothetical protein [uncultured Polaribacter sp.]
MTGAIGSIVAPWFKWKLEQKKESRNEKVTLLRELRKFLEKNEPKEKDFINSEIYMRIRPYLSNEFVEELEDNTSGYISPNSRSYYKGQLLKELEVIEDSWDLSLSKKGKKKKEYNVKSITPLIKVSMGIYQPKKK